MDKFEGTVVVYGIRHTYRNATSSPRRVRIGLDHQEIFELFNSPETRDSARAVYQYNPDSASTPPRRQRIVKPAEQIAWSRTLTISIAGQNGPSGLPRPGMYYVHLFPDITVVERRPGEDLNFTPGETFPIEIKAPPAKVAVCKR